MLILIFQHNLIAMVKQQRQNNSIIKKNEKKIIINVSKNL
jgi:hypothetical protein